MGTSQGVVVNPLTPGLRRQKQEDLGEIEASQRELHREV